MYQATDCLMVDAYARRDIRQLIGSHRKPVNLRSTSTFSSYSTTITLSTPSTC